MSDKIGWTIYLFSLPAIPGLCMLIIWFCEALDRRDAKRKAAESPPA
ncbi:MAG: hypothetical protein FD180_4382 [Planctomycetota bacterium]|nr:MAG: hypothetical protein FD180_4382 [Planctomycetota bacterium]